MGGCKDGDRNGGVTQSRFISGERWGTGGAGPEGLGAKVDALYIDCGLSCPVGRGRGGGGGVKDAFDDGSGDDLYAVAGDPRVAGDMPEAGSSAYCEA
jgi:hypothetical protein